MPSCSIPITVLCAICTESPAEIVDIEQGPICFDCHENLESADRAIAFLIETQTKTHDLPSP